MKPKTKKIITLSIVVLVVLAITLLLYKVAGKEPFIRTALSGLTLGSLFFLVAAGLTLIFGLMDVLNFAHGSMFMLGAYMGWQLYTNPTFIFALLPHLLAFATGVMLLPLIKPTLVRMKLPEKWVNAIPKITLVLALLLAVFSFIGFDILAYAKTAMVAASATYWIRPVLIFLSGLLVAIASAKPGNKQEFAVRERLSKTLPVPVIFFILTILALVVRESAPKAVLLMDGNLRFAIAVLVSIIFGFVFGQVVEITLIRPLYVRPTFIIIMTLGLSYVIRELVQLLWDPLAYQMVRPPFAAQPGKAANLLEWFQKGSSTLNIFGVTFPTYRLFVIALGIVMFIFITILMTRSRLGMIIRAGVQDPQMVEALGINVKSIFTLVFALGVAMAALGGIGAGPFLPIQPLMGDQYQTQGLITVVIGGMGSYVGAFIGAMILGMARAFGDYFALKYSLSTAIAEASTVIIMIIVLLARPQGLFGKKE
jgi:branched-chain amino acid transport system permease protein